VHESDSLIEYAISCIIFHHKYDDSYKITEAAERHESELFNDSIQFLRKVALEENEIIKLKDKIEMYDFFYEGNGFKKRGLNNAIQIADYIEKLEKQITGDGENAIHD